MEISGVFTHKVIRPLAKWGYTGNFWEINIDTLIATAVAFALMGVFVVVVRIAMSRRPNLFSHALEVGTDLFKNWVEESIGYFDAGCFSFIFGLFCFTFFCNISEALPFAEPATGDVNTTLAIGITCFMYVQMQGIRHKRWGYLKKYFEPIFIFFPINLIGQLSKIVSLAFRLFGNILGGTIILSLLLGLFERFQLFLFPFILVGIASAWVFEKYFGKNKYPLVAKILGFVMGVVYIIPGAQIVLCIVIGTIQAAVIGLLATIYLSSEIGGDKEISSEAVS